MYGYFCTGFIDFMFKGKGLLNCINLLFIDFMLKGKGLLNYINSLSPNEFENNDKIILKNFQ